MILDDSARVKSHVTTHQGCKNFGRQKAVATKFCAVAPELPSGASDFEVDPTLLENMYTPVCFLLGNTPASGVYMPMFRNTPSVPFS